MSNIEPLVSICIPTYNGERFIAHAIESALAQTYQPLEIVISDDGSCDRTLEIVQEYVRTTEIPFKIVHGKRQGLAVNWNNCAREARGEYIKYLFQDDTLEPTCVAELMNVMLRDEGVGLVFCPRNLLTGDDPTERELLGRVRSMMSNMHLKWSCLYEIQDGICLLSDPNLFKLPLNKVGEPTVTLIRRSNLFSVGLFDESLHYVVDLDMWLRLMRCCRVGFVDQRLAGFRIHTGQYTWDNLRSGNMVKEIVAWLERINSEERYSFIPAPNRQAAARMALSNKDMYRTNNE